MSKIKNSLVLATAVVALAACAKKPPPDLPPAPGPAPTATPAPSGNVGNTPVPGSQADFLAKVSSDRVFFDTDRFNIDTEDQLTLQSQARWLAQYPNKQVVVEGHADERGTRDYNLALGERRANAAKNYLVTLGIAASRIRVVSYGKEAPKHWARPRPPGRRTAAR